jgi:HEAT repeat protein
MARTPSQGFVDVPPPPLENPLHVDARSLLLMALFVAGCASDGPRPIDPAVDLFSPSGTRRSHAIQQVARSGDTDYVPQLISMLDDGDETVRLQAHAALRELTPYDTGYVPFAERAERARHMQQWEQLWAERASPSVAEPVVQVPAERQP